MNPLSREEALELLRSVPVAHIGVVSDGAPYVSPMSFVVVGDRVAFRNIKIRRIK